MDSNNRRRRANAQSRKPRRRLESGVGTISHPPTIGNLAITHSTRLRFISNAATPAGGSVITVQNLVDTILFGLTTTTANKVFQSVRLRAVEVWAVPVVGGATTVEVTFAGISSNAGDEKLHTDTSMGIQPAHVRAKPAKNSLAAMWAPASTLTSFVITAPSGSVIDLEISFRSQPGFNSPAQNAPVAGFVGLAWRGFDGLAIGTTKFTPVDSNNAI